MRGKLREQGGGAERQNSAFRFLLKKVRILFKGYRMKQSEMRKERANCLARVEDSKAGAMSREAFDERDREAGSRASGSEREL